MPAWLRKLKFWRSGPLAPVARKVEGPDMEKIAMLLLNEMDQAMESEGIKRAIRQRVCIRGLAFFEGTLKRAGARMEKAS